ncbi:hypothetical protein NECID01_1678 [Nematocida sp. AWRm77]|nr:hypothetical protein NECID01_1678 [Nematocida sp. AWRm77]
MVKAVYCSWIILLKCTVLVHSTGIESLDFELISEVDMTCADINPDNFYSDYSGTPISLPRANLQNDASSSQQSVLQEEQALNSSCSLDVPALSNAVNTVDANEGFSAFSSASLPLPSTSTGTGAGTASSISSVQVQSSAISGKRACGTTKKARKRQKTNTTTSTAAEANTALMDETEVCIAIEEFNQYFGKDIKVLCYISQDTNKFAEDLAQRGLASVHSREIMNQCMAPEKWLGHSVFWRMLVVFMDAMSLELAASNRLEDKKTIILRNRKIRGKPLSECTREHIRYVIAKYQGTERMEMQCSLGILEDRGTANVLFVLRWLLYHVNIQCIGISCDLTEAGMTSKVLGRQIAPLTKEWRGSRVRIDSLALRFSLAQYKDAAVILKECPWVTVLKMHFIIDADSRETGVINQVLKGLLLHCPALEQLSIVGVRVSVGHIRTIAALHPQLVLLEVELLSLKKLELGQKNEKESMLVFPGLKTLKILSLYNYYSYTAIEKFMRLFSSLKNVQIPSRYVTTPLIDTLSSMRLLRSLETVNGLLSTETVEYLLEKLPTLECLSVGVKELGNKLAHVLSKCTGMHSLNLRGRYTPGFLASLLQPSPLMNTLKLLNVWKNSGASYRRGKFSAEDLSSKEAAMKNFSCAVEIIY